MSSQSTLTDKSAPSSEKVSALATAPQDAFPASYHLQAPSCADSKSRPEYAFPTHPISPTPTDQRPSTDRRLFQHLRLPPRPAHLHRPPDIPSRALARPSHRRIERDGRQIRAVFQGLEVVHRHQSRLRRTRPHHRAPLPSFRRFECRYHGRGYAMEGLLGAGDEGALEGYGEGERGLRDRIAFTYSVTETDLL